MTTVKVIDMSVTSKSFFVSFVCFFVHFVIRTQYEIYLLRHKTACCKTANIKYVQFLYSNYTSIKLKKLIYLNFSYISTFPRIL